MFPTMTMNDSAHLSESYRIFTGKRDQRLTKSSLFSKFNNLFDFQSRSVDFLAAILSMLGNLIRYILRLSSKREMRWTNAPTKIAGMHNAFSLRDRAYENFVTRCMCTLMLMPNRKRSIARFWFGNPFPAPVSPYLNLGHEVIEANAGTPVPSSTTYRFPFKNAAAIERFNGSAIALAHPLMRREDRHYRESSKTLLVHVSNVITVGAR